jgi:hypothetical protein
MTNLLGIFHLAVISNLLAFLIMVGACCGSAAFAFIIPLRATATTAAGTAASTVLTTAGTVVGADAAQTARVTGMSSR